LYTIKKVSVTIALVTPLTHIAQNLENCLCW